MKHKISIIVLTAVVMLVILIGICNYRLVQESSKIPDIVFVEITNFTELGDGRTYEMTFCDKNGKHYVSKDPFRLGFDFEVLIEDYRNGKLDGQITYDMTCDLDELVENYKKLCKVSRNRNLKINYPESAPAVQSIKTTWYGLYYDAFGNVQYVEIHKYDRAGSLYTNDENANEIYDWYIGAFHEK